MSSSIIGLKKANCKNCYRCVKVCPVKSIRVADGQATIIDRDCILCGTCLEHYGLSPDRLKIEITERVAAQDVDRTASVMAQLSDLGIYFYLDDFGTGWSNLSCALDMPFQCVKLDHSLLTTYPDNPQSRQLVHGLVSLFHELGAQVVAEGVESRAQADALTACGVDWLQGYYLARPMSEEALLPFLQNAQKEMSPRV